MRLLILFAATLSLAAASSCPARGEESGATCGKDNQGVCHCGTAEEPNGLCRCLTTTITDLDDIINTADNIAQGNGQASTGISAISGIENDPSSRKRRRRHRHRHHFSAPFFYTPRHFRPHHFFQPRRHFFHRRRFHPRSFSPRHFPSQFPSHFDEAPEAKGELTQLPAETAFEKNMKAAEDEATPANEMNGKMMGTSPMILPKSENFGSVLVTDDMPQMIVLLKKKRDMKAPVKEPIIVVREQKEDLDEKQMIAQVINEIAKESKQADEVDPQTEETTETENETAVAASDAVVTDPIQPSHSHKLMEVTLESAYVGGKPSNG